nr:MAG TPA: hypothetical protein [Caudoviricetes sp.]
MVKKTSNKRPPLKEIFKAKRFLSQELVGAKFHSSPEPFEFNECNWIANEKPEVVKAMSILARAGIYLSISGHEYMMREKALCANIS